MKTTAKVLFASLLLSTAAAQAQQIKRTPIPNSNFPISVAVTVPANAETIYFSGVLPDVADAAAPKGTPTAYGSTETQTLSLIHI